MQAERSPEPAAPLAVVFDRLRGFASRTHHGLHAALEGGSLLARTDDGVRIAVPRGFSAQRLRDRQEQLQTVCEQFFGRPMQVEIAVEGDEARATAPRPDPEALRRLRQAALNDPGVMAAVEVLEGEIVEIRPLGGGR